MSVALKQPMIVVDRSVGRAIVVNRPVPQMTGGGGGGAGPLTVTHTAGEALGGHRAVAIASNGKAMLVSPGDTLADAVIGLTIGAAALNAAATIQTEGELSEAGWSWTAGPIWLGASGVPTQTIPTTGSIVRLGEAVGPTTILINPRLVARI